MFRKYPSIENHYQQSYISRFMSKNPSYTETVFCVQEKIDGANIQIIMKPNEKYQVGKRNSLLENGENFFDIWNVLLGKEKELEIVQNKINEIGETRTFYGELYGPGINSRVNYGKSKDIKFFDMADSEGMNYSKETTEKFFEDLELTSLFIPVLFKGGLTDCLRFNSEFDSAIINIETNISEGVVVSAYSRSSGFKVKIKNEAFKEKENKTPPKEKIERLVTVEELKQRKIKKDVSEYINKNRVIGIINKNGEMSSMKDMGRYINLVIEDAYEDYVKDNPSEKISLDEVKGFGFGSVIALLIKEQMIKVAA